MTVSIPRRYPYTSAVVSVVATAFCVLGVKAFAGFAPLILLAVAAAACLTVLGLRAGVLALVLSAVVSDFFFVEPLLTLTRHSLILGALYSVAALVSRRLAGAR